MEVALSKSFAKNLVVVEKIRCHHAFAFDFDTSSFFKDKGSKFFLNRKRNFLIVFG